MSTLAHPGIKQAQWRRRVSALPGKVWVGAAIVAMFLLIAVCAPLLAPFSPLAQDPINRLASLSARHWLGTDELGRDTFSRLIYATRVDLPIGLLGAAAPALVGTLLGVVAGYFGSWVDAVIMRIADIMQAFPSYILIIGLVAAFGQGAITIVIAFTVLGWVVYARLIRTEVIRIASLAYIQAAQTAGLPEYRVIRYHVLPNVVGQTLVYVPSDIMFATLGLAAFSYLGLGVPAPTAEWGEMIAAGQPYLREQWWLATVPGLVLVIYGFGLQLLGEGFEEAQR